MSHSLTISLIMMLSYALGSITGAYYIVKAFTGKDIRKVGSGNVGATNAGRMAGKKGFLLTIFIDAGKVILALFITSVLIKGEGYLILSSLMVVMGHLFPFQLGFHGGKGIVAYLASALFLCPLSIVVFAIMMGGVYIVIRKYTLAGFLSMASIPITAIMIEDSFIKSAGLGILFVIILLSHNRSFHHSVQT
ncbi:glycerol-3-phosphate acyltransferase [Rossellomorea aquimaris]|uniref:glycerol-3-phosphate acyltransferase n=1 Tax=Rossellomorea aquimaris TaxID=189382 RepID=UPI001CD68818|nr:glycerol-3-phosphate acyltransferase [Rossellomorea aquimaris]MCA1058975.1 glycerol-3-phosphate acyltransferase [Rossellomorea aquimaris]